MVQLHIQFLIIVIQTNSFPCFFLPCKLKEDGMVRFCVSLAFLLSSLHPFIFLSYFVYRFTTM